MWFGYPVMFSIFLISTKFIKLKCRNVGPILLRVINFRLRQVQSFQTCLWQIRKLRSPCKVVLGRCRNTYTHLVYLTLMSSEVTRDLNLIYNESSCLFNNQARYAKVYHINKSLCSLIKIK